VVQRIQRFAQSGIFKRRVLEYVARDLVRMHFAADPDRSAHGGAVFKNRSVRGGQAYYENSRRGPKLDSSTRSMSKATAAAILAAAEDASRRCPPVSSDRSASHRGDASSHLASYIGNKPLPAGVYLPVATPYSRRLSVVLDSLDSDGDGRVARSDLQAALKKLGYRVEEAEAAELFDVVDVERRGAVERAELSASLLDWKWLQDTFKDRWVESVQRVFQNLDKDGDGALDANEVAAAFSGHLDDYEVDAAVHEALMEAFADEGEDAGDEEGALKHQRIDFDHFLRLLQTGRYLEDLELYDDRLSEHSSRVVTGEFKPVAQSDRKGGGIGSLFKCCMGQ
jgi:Ca2+-binding EF-hand superfamily protein